MAAMFPKINPLPCAKRHFPMNDWNAEINRSQSCANMSRHIVIAFARVTKNQIAIGNESREKAFKVAANFWIGIFLD